MKNRRASSGYPIWKSCNLDRSNLHLSVTWQEPVPGSASANCRQYDCRSIRIALRLQRGAAYPFYDADCWDRRGLILRGAWTGSVLRIAQV